MNLADKKRNIQGYEEMYAVRLAGGEVILAENKDADARYMVCDYKSHTTFGINEYSNAVGGADYLEIIKEFTRRLSERIFTLESERSQRGLPLEVLTAADCEPKGLESDLNGRAVVIKSESLAPEYRTADHQLAMVTGGFGASPNSMGQTVYIKSLYDGTDERWSRSDIAGTVAYERLPDWARQAFDILKKPGEKESVPAAPEPLGKERFWQMIDAARETAGGRWQDMYEPLLESVSQLEEPDIIRFKQIQNEYQGLSYKDKLWAVATLMNGGCSDDGFEDFRGWLIAQGKEVYMNALADPDSLAGVETVKSFGSETASSDFTPPSGYKHAANFESFLYIVSYAYEKKFGRDADLYAVLAQSSLSDQEKADISGEIRYAADIDTRSWRGSGSWDGMMEKMRPLLPNLHKLFDDSDAISEERGPAKKESVLDQIRLDRQEKKQGDHEKPKTTKKDKSGPEL